MSVKQCDVESGGGRWDEMSVKQCGVSATDKDAVQLRTMVHEKHHYASHNVMGPLTSRSPSMQAIGMAMKSYVLLQNSLACSLHDL